MVFAVVVRQAVVGAQGRRPEEAVGDGDGDRGLGWTCERARAQKREWALMSP